MNTLAPERVRQLRGLVLAARRVRDVRLASHQYRRGLIGTYRPGGDDGVCRWCTRPTEGRKRWHLPCVDAYRLAAGSVIGNRGIPMLEPAPCACGQTGTELDHQDAMAVAFWSGDWRRILRAHTLGNLAWLCHKCHAAKTAGDLREAGRMRRAARCLIVVRDTPRGPVWSTLAGARVYPRRRQQRERQLPKAVFDPQGVTCPRCLWQVARAAPEEDGWRLDAAAIDSGMSLTEWVRAQDSHMAPLPGLFTKTAQGDSPGNPLGDIQKRKEMAE